jgi:DNA-binding protein H-NS
VGEKLVRDGRKDRKAMRQLDHVLRNETMSSRVEMLKRQLAELDKRISVAWQQEQRAAIEHVRQVMNFFNLVPNQLRIDRRGTYNTRPLQMKYQDPVTGATWSGRGRAPSWIRNRSYNDFLIKQSDTGKS